MEARARHAEKESAKGKKRRGRKRKSGTPEPDESTADTVRRGRKRKNFAQETPEPSAKVARLSKAPASARASAAQKGGRLEDELLLEPWRAPMARMY